MSFDPEDLSKRILSFFLVMGLFASVIILGNLTVGLGRAAAEDSTLEKIRRSGQIIIGHRKGAHPFSFVDEQGQPQGYSIDLCKQIADAVKQELSLPKLDVVYQEISPVNHIEKIEANQVDVVCGATTLTLKRRERVSFSLLIFVGGGAALLPVNSDIRGPADLANKRLGVRADTTADKAVTSGILSRGMTVKISRYRTHLEGLRALEAGLIDVYLADRILLISLADKAKEPDKFRLSDRFFTYEPYALMLRRDAIDFQLIADRTIAKLYRSRQINELYKKWFASFGAKVDEFQLRAMYRLQSIPEG